MKRTARKTQIPKFAVYMLIREQTVENTLTNTLVVSWPLSRPVWPLHHMASPYTLTCVLAWQSMSRAWSSGTDKTCMEALLLRSQWIHCDEMSVCDEKCDEMCLSVCVPMFATGPSVDVFVQDAHTFLYYVWHIYTHISKDASWSLSTYFRVKHCCCQNNIQF